MRALKRVTNMTETAGRVARYRREYSKPHAAFKSADLDALALRACTRVFTADYVSQISKNNSLWLQPKYEEFVYLLLQVLSTLSHLRIVIRQVLPHTTSTSAPQEWKILMDFRPGALPDFHTEGVTVTGAVGGGFMRADAGAGHGLVVLYHTEETAGAPHYTCDLLRTGDCTLVVNQELMQRLAERHWGLVLRDNKNGLRLRPVRQVSDAGDAIFVVSHVVGTDTHTGAWFSLQNCHHH